MKSKSGEPIKISIRRWKKSDFSAIIECQKLAYQDIQALDIYDEHKLETQLRAFPEGQFVALVDEKIVGYASSLIVELDDSDNKRYFYDDITGNMSFNTHDPSGDTLYAADIAVNPEYRNLGISKKLYQRRKKLLSKFNLRRMVAYGRIPQYHEVAGQMTPEEYVEEVRKEKRKDSSLSAHLRAGYSVKAVLLDFYRDQSGLNYSTFLEYLNEDYDEGKRRVAASPISRTNRRMRVCTSQFEVRSIHSWKEFEYTCRFFGKTASTYHCHFLVFPEYFTTSLRALFPDENDPIGVVYKLADMSNQILELMVDIAVKEQLYIIAGTTPVKRGDKIYNVAYFITPTGEVHSQDKIHITPGEREEWGISPGEKLKIFETPFGRIAIQVCYDVEFPESTRLLAMAGVEVLFVPFNTDEPRSFNRVKYCAQARAVENYIYVVTSGLVGNLFSSGVSLINYGQSAVYTPSDVAFPDRATSGIADPNTETVVTAELDLEILTLQREIGTVRPFFDRRSDMYELNSKIAIEKIRV